VQVELWFRCCLQLAQITIVLAMHAVMPMQLHSGAVMQAVGAQSPACELALTATPEND
jgi:hypothetical protein